LLGTLAKMEWVFRSSKATCTELGYAVCRIAQKVLGLYLVDYLQPTVASYVQWKIIPGSLNKSLTYCLELVGHYNYAIMQQCVRVNFDSGTHAVVVCTSSLVGVSLCKPDLLPRRIDDS